MVFISVTGVRLGTNGNNSNTMSFRHRGFITTNNPSNNSNNGNNGVIFGTSDGLSALTSFECGEGCSTRGNRGNNASHYANGSTPSLIVSIPINALMGSTRANEVVTSVSASTPMVVTGNNGNN